MIPRSFVSPLGRDSLRLHCWRTRRPHVPILYGTGLLRCQSNATGGGNDYQFQPGQAQAGPNSQQWGSAESKEHSGMGGSWNPTLFKMFESAATTFASLAILGLAGYGYHRYYKYLVLQKIEKAFMPGDPVLELATFWKENSSDLTVKGDHPGHWFSKEEQDKIDAIISGRENGRYYLLIGEKGTGKSSMLLNGMQQNGGEGVSMFESHADLEIFRIRLGKALDFEYHEDYIGSLFSIRGPRDTTALLDIERALNKLEKVALSRREKVGRPLVLIINSVHLLRDDEDGRDVLELIQQRAEQWAASRLVTVVLNSDDYWVYERLKQNASRMEVLPITDWPKDRAQAALRAYRKTYFQQEPSQELLDRVFERVGGRLSFLSRVAKAPDMLAMCEQICRTEKAWFLNQCWILGEEMDDDVMNQQKYASSAMLLAKALVDKEAEEENSPSSSSHHHDLPSIPLHHARQIMTRADFIQQYDASNLFTIDSDAMVRADSRAMQNAFRDVCAHPDFPPHLDATLKRIAAIESLGRTRELVAKCPDVEKGEVRIVLR